MALTPERAKVLGRQGGKASGKARARLSLARVEEELGPLRTVEDAMHRLDRLGLWITAGLLTGSAGSAAVRSIIDRHVRALRDQLIQLKVPQLVEEQFAEYRDDPVGFCKQVLGVESARRRSTGEPYQFRILEDVAHHPRVAVRSGHGVGKSAINAWAAVWWLLTRPLSRVVVLAPEFSRQIRAILFSEIRKWVRRAQVSLPVTRGLAARMDARYAVRSRQGSGALRHQEHRPRNGRV